MTRARRAAAALFLALAAVSPARAADELSPWQDRTERERRWRSEGLSLIPHRLSYFLPVTYESSPSQPPGQPQPKTLEAKFQISFKMLILNDIANRPLHLYAGYTQLSMWELYNRRRSAPFRDNNYEPELILRAEAERALPHGFTLRNVDLSINHVSNGQTDPLSRSWNRVIVDAVLERGGLLLSIRPWWRVPEHRSADDNRDIEDYLGHGEVSASFQRKNHTLSVMLRNNLHTHKNRGAVRIEYTFPLTRNLNGLIQYFNGYGESLLDYNNPSNRIGIGIALSDWY